MSQIRILAVEDNPTHARKLTVLLDELSYDLIDVVADASSALRLVKATLPDLVLMDIKIKGSVNGIELSQKIQEIHAVPIIFITALDDDATFEKAKSTDPYAYLIKPVRRNALQRAIELAIYKFANIPEESFAGWQQDLLLNGSILIKDKNRLIKLNLEDIQYIEAIDRYCHLQAVEDKMYTVRISLKEMVQQLPSSQFMQIHRSHVVNVQCIDSIDLENNQIMLNNGHVPLGRTYKNALLKNTKWVG